MAQIANIILPDAQATPVNHTFVPTSINAAGVATWQSQEGNYAIGNWMVTQQLSRPALPSAGMSSAGRIIQHRIGLYMPELEVVTNSTSTGIKPAPTVAYFNKANVTFLLPERGERTTRADLAKILIGLLSDPSVQDAVLDFEASY